jgi:cell division protein FtsB
LAFLPGFAKLQELKTRLWETEEATREAQQQIVLLEQRIEQMKTDRDYLEMVAREKLGVVRKGETVVKIVTEDNPTNATDPQ